MAARRRKVSVVCEAEGHAVDKLKRRKELFIQQFNKEAQERLQEMDAKLEKLLATLDSAFKIELMKLPPSLHTTLMKDIITAQETNVGEVTMAIAATSEISCPLVRKPSGRGKVSNSGAQQKSVNQKPEEGNKRRTKKTMKSSNSTGSLRSASTTTSRSHSYINKLSDSVKTRFTSHSLSEDLSSSATALITTSVGETLLVSEETKDEIKLDLLDDLAICQMKKIKELMEYLCNKKLNSTQ